MRLNDLSVCGIVVGRVVCSCEWGMRLTSHAFEGDHRTRAEGGGRGRWLVGSFVSALYQILRRRD